MVYIVGLTGGIASGKTTVTQLFEKLNVPVLDADLIARDLVSSNTTVFNQIVAYFGTTILLPSGELDRHRLRQIIFTDKKQQQWLNNLLHPQVETQLLLLSKQYTDNYLIWSVPLLIEAKFTKYCDRILVIDTSVEIQINRTIARDNCSAELVRQIITRQITREQRLSYADDVIYNDQNTSQQDLQLRVQQLHQKYLALAKKKIN